MATATETSSSYSGTDTGSGGGTDSSSGTDIDTTVIPEVVADDEARFNAVRGVNPNTGATANLIELVAADKNLAALCLVLRAAPVGSLHSLDADLRSVEASCRAAITLRGLFQQYGLDLAVKSPEEFKKWLEEQRALNNPPATPESETSSSTESGTSTSSGRTTKSSTSSSSSS